MSTGTTGGSGDRPTESIALTLNGEEVAAEVEPRLKLSDFLREERDLRGVRVGCEHGVCGACTVLLDGRVVKSCLVYAVQADGRDVETVESLAEDGHLHPVQEAFHEAHALQCGFCTSGFVMSAVELLRENRDPSREAVKTALADNICRCTGYHNIYDAVERAAEAMRAGEGEGDGEAVADGGLGSPSADAGDDCGRVDGSVVGDAVPPTGYPTGDADRDVDGSGGDV
jgi:carbon-monoxide dehydrogenase small subunit